SSLDTRINDAEKALYSRRGDVFWLKGYTLLFLDPSLILFTIRLPVIASVWLALWLMYLVFVIRYFPRTQPVRQNLQQHRHPRDPIKPGFDAAGGDPLKETKPPERHA